MSTVSSFAQRFLPIVAVVLITVVAHRLVPSSMGILPRIFVITGIVVVALWITSRGIKYWNARSAPAGPKS